MRAGQSYQRRAISRAGIRVVDDHRPSAGEGCSNELLLPPLRLAGVAHEILADMIVGAGKLLAVEGCLPRRGQADEDDAVSHE